MIFFPSILCVFLGHSWDIQGYTGGYVKHCERCGKVEAFPF